MLLRSLRIFDIFNGRNIKWQYLSKCSADFLSYNLFFGGGGGGGLMGPEYKTAGHIFDIKKRAPFLQVYFTYLHGGITRQSFMSWLNHRLRWSWFQRYRMGRCSVFESSNIALCYIILQSNKLFKPSKQLRTLERDYYNLIYQYIFINDIIDLQKVKYCANL